MRIRFSRVIWGIVLLLAAAFVLTNQFGSFAGLSIGRIIAAVLAVIIFVQSLAEKNFAVLPLPLAVLYFVFQAQLGLPYIRLWALIPAAVLAIAGISLIAPQKFRFSGHYHSAKNRPRLQTEDGPSDNNPSVSVNFGSISRRLNAERLETVNLHSSFGALQIYLDQAELSPDGAEVFVDCDFGAVELFVPKHWRIINRLACTLGGVEDHGGGSSAADAPQLTLSGRVSFGGIEVKYV